MSTEIHFTHFMKQLKKIIDDMESVSRHRNNETNRGRRSSDSLRTIKREIENILRDTHPPSRFSDEDIEKEFKSNPLIFTKVLVKAPLFSPILLDVKKIDKKKINRFI